MNQNWKPIPQHSFSKKHSVSVKDAMNWHHAEAGLYKPKAKSSGLLGKAERNKVQTIISGESAFSSDRFPPHPDLFF